MISGTMVADLPAGTEAIPLGMISDLPIAPTTANRAGMEC